MRARGLALLAAAFAGAACGGHSSTLHETGTDAGKEKLGGGGGTGTYGESMPGAPPNGAVDTSTGGTSPAARFTAKLGSGHAGHFLIGMGNDGTDDGDDPAYGLGVTLDLHYQYLTGLSTQGGWTTYNSNPDYAADRINQCVSHGVVPMFTYYCMAADGENNLAGSVASASYMAVYWQDYIQLLGDIHAASVPVVLHFEPDFWAYAQQAANGGGPSAVSASVASSNAPECSGQPENLVGYAQCVIKLARSRAPTALVGFHASPWATGVEIQTNTDPSFDVAGEAATTLAFFQALGAGDADFVATDMLDRDAGCYEAQGPGCTSMGATGLYWDETNATLPNFQQELAWAGAISQGLGLPILWWQLPFGSPASTPGGAPSHYRDNRVHYIFGHLGQYVAAGGVGAVWGTGSSGQTDVTTDNGEYQGDVTAYFQSPLALP
jgi:hypothetical protein